MRAWNESIYSERTLPNATRLEQAKLRAIAEQDAAVIATGKAGCDVNMEAGAWFFFTVMTTVGYGNQSPVTVEGQAMIYTVGFLSILLFALVATQSGRITALLVDDLMKKSHLVWLSRPFWAALLWGILYWAWLVLVSFYTLDWKVSRRGEGFQFADAYWFAYISTTTVGLGDVFLEPEPILGQDLLFFSLMFLIGFVFLAIFLGKLQAVFAGLHHVGGNTIEQSLADTSLCCGHAVVKTVTRTANTAYCKSGQMLMRHRSSSKSQCEQATATSAA